MISHLLHLVEVVLAGCHVALLGHALGERAGLGGAWAVLNGAQQVRMDDSGVNKQRWQQGDTQDEHEWSQRLRQGQMISMDILKNVNIYTTDQSSDGVRIGRCGWEEGGKWHRGARQLIHQQEGGACSSQYRCSSGGCQA